MNIYVLPSVFVLMGAASFVIGIICRYAYALPEWLVQVANPNNGHTNKSKEESWIVKCTQVPRSWFAHFYAYAVVLQAAVFYTVLNIYLYGDNENENENQNDKTTNHTVSLLSFYIRQTLEFLCGRDAELKLKVETTMLLATFLFLLQVTRRLYECYFVSIFSGSKMNVAYYLVGFTHYTGSTFALCTHDGGNTAFGSSNSIYFQIFGTLLFFYGWCQQLKAHQQFADLRKRKEKGRKTITLEHQIPVGGLFEKISCPNYWAEILIYIAMSSIYEFSNINLNCILFFVVSNQIITGLLNHDWYHKTFVNYPKQRKAIIPYIL